MTSKASGKGYKRSYAWAQNPLKLNEAIFDLEREKKLDPSVVIDEVSIKEQYRVRNGVVIDDESVTGGPATPADDAPETTDDETPKRKSRFSKE